MEFCIVSEKSLDRIFLELFLASPFPESYDHLAELCAVVTEMIDPDDIESHSVIELVDRVAYDSAPDMAYMERFCDIRR